MKHAPAILWTITGVLTLAGPAWAWRWHHAASTRVYTEFGRLTSLREKAAEITCLRSASPKSPVRAHDEGSLAPRVASILASSGVPASVMASLSPQTQSVTAPDGTKLVKRSAAVTLTPMRLPELGAFLNAWRTAEPSWTISSIEVTPDPGAGVTPGADLPLRINLTIESISSEDSGAMP